MKKWAGTSKNDEGQVSIRSVIRKLNTSYRIQPEADLADSYGRSAAIAAGQLARHQGQLSANSSHQVKRAADVEI